MLKQMNKLKDMYYKLLCFCEIKMKLINNFKLCDSVEECKKLLIQFGHQDITAAAIARVFGKVSL